MKVKSIKERIKEYFFINPSAKLRVRQIEREVSIPLPSAISYAKELVTEGILKTIIIGKVKLYTADRASKNFLFEKKLFNLRSLHLSGLVDYLITEYQNPVIMLFGSYSLGEDIETSDVDIYIETPQKEIKGLEQFEKKLKRKIQIFQYRDILAIKNKELANNIINGIALNGYLEVFK